MGVSTIVLYWNLAIFFCMIKVQCSLACVAYLEYNVYLKTVSVDRSFSVWVVRQVGPV